MSCDATMIKMRKVNMKLTNWMMEVQENDLANCVIDLIYRSVIFWVVFHRAAIFVRDV